MLKRSLLLGPLVFAFVFVLASPAHADTITYVAIMDGANEVPPTGSPATGTTDLTLNGTLLSIFVTFSGLTGGPASAAHIHCCAPPGSNAGVAVPFNGFPSATSGTYSNTVDLSLLATYNPAFVTAEGGLANAEAALLAGLNDNMTYSNIHNTIFPGGEIRGFIEVVTPEPTSLLLLGTGMIGVVQMLRKRARA